MSTVKDRNVIDYALVEDGRYVLLIDDDLEWSFAGRERHRGTLLDKINDYLTYIAGGQAEEAQPGLRPVIRVMGGHAFSRYAVDLLENVKDQLRAKGDLCDIEWTHWPEGGPFEDGFSDDFVFDIDKIYPRLRKNWAKDPLSEVRLLAPSADSPDYSDNVVMFRVMERLVGMFVQDIGPFFTYITYDMLPEDLTVEELEDRAFRNLVRDVRYSTAEGKEKGVYGVLAGGNFEAESLCLAEIWRSAAKDLGDDIVITIPTKDMVLFTKANDRKLKERMLKMAEEIFRLNQKDNTALIFSTDLFTYSRERDEITITGEW